MSSLIEQFQDAYGQRPRLFRAPGRVNLIGEHTDYNDGFVMPAALDFATVVAAAPRDDGRLVIRSLSFEGEEMSFPIDESEAVKAGHWSDYVRGSPSPRGAAVSPLEGASLMLEGNVPLGAGLSSSASVEVATALALLTLAAQPMTHPEIALLCQQAENEFVGMRCGIMDQYISACGKAGHALMLDCRSLETQLLPLPQEAQIVIVNSMVRHELAGGEYNERRQACEEGARLIGVAALRDATLEQVEHLEDPLLRRRCRHVVSENSRVEEAAAALTSGDFARFGQLMALSHLSMRDDYEISCPELDLLVDLALPLPGVYGARMTGGGFGGCTVNLVRQEEVAGFLQAVSQGYPQGQAFVCNASDGASEIAPRPMKESA